MQTEIYFTLQVDCEATQRSISNAALGERALRGLAEVLDMTGMRATFVAIPPEVRALASVFRELASAGHEIGLHLHPADQGYDEFLGVYGADDQRQIIGEAAQVFADHLGYAPVVFVPGYHSANDHTFPVLEALGFRHGSVSMPTRDLPHLACVWGHSPLEPHYPHRYHRSLIGDVDFVDLPATLDLESRLWGGAHPQDLRVELVDAKNHWYTIDKNVRRLIAGGAGLPVKHLKASTHNIFEFQNPQDFRRETLLGIIAAARQVCDQADARLVPATMADIAQRFRASVPRLTDGQRLLLDERGRPGWSHLAPEA